MTKNIDACKKYIQKGQHYFLSTAMYTVHRDEQWLAIQIITYTVNFLNLAHLQRSIFCSIDYIIESFRIVGLLYILYRVK